MEEKNAVAAEVNRLYWQTEESIAGISNRLGVSRRALYELVEPLSAESACGNCGAELAYINRSTKSAGLARCVACGNEQEIDQEISHEDVGTIPRYEDVEPLAPRHGPGNNSRAATIMGLAIAGVAVGVLATLLIKRKR